MTVVAVLQARLSSTRLPGKVLLPLAGLPLMVLAARRAGNAGIPVVVATSVESSDDPVAEVAAAHGLTCVRGPLDDTLHRFVQALAPYQDDDIVVRLTADNVIPDGGLIAEMVEDFTSRSLEYLICAAGTSGLPYGVSVEVMHVRALREADRTTDDPRDREHVTPAVRRLHGEAQFEKYSDLGLGLHRATVDQLSDYVRMASLFSQVRDPLAASVSELSLALARLPGAPVASRPLDDLVLGTAQLGMRYGVANEAGQPSVDVARDLVRTAIVNGVSYLDTARAYGSSEDVLGVALGEGWASRVQVVTKLAPLAEVSADTPVAVIRALVDKSVLESCRALRVRTLPTLLLHRASHLRDRGGAVWRRLVELRDEGIVTRLGVSVQNPAELALALATAEVEHIQLPFNLLDWRWDDLAPRLQEARRARKLVVHVRSALLQGLLASGRPELWDAAGTPDGDDAIRWLRRTVDELGRRDVADLAFAFVRAQEWCDGVVVGMESTGQLEANMSAFELPALTADEVAHVRRTRPAMSEDVLDPSRWRRPA